MRMIRSPKSPLEWEAYYALRYEILRKPLNQPKGSEKNEGDKKAKHFALFCQDQIVAVARLDILDKHTNQARFVGVTTKLQGKGFGKAIMEALESETRREKKTILLLHARENAVDFYKSIGYQVEEKSYLLFNQIQHYKMTKVVSL